MEEEAATTEVKALEPAETKEEQAATKEERTIPVRIARPAAKRNTTSTGKATVGAAMLWTGALVFIAKGYLGKVAEWVSAKVA